MKMFTESAKKAFCRHLAELHFSAAKYESRVSHKTASRFF